MLSVKSLAALAFLAGSAIASEHHEHKRGVQYVTVANTVYVTAEAAVPTFSSAAAEVASSAAGVKTTSAEAPVVASSASPAKSEAASSASAAPASTESAATGTGSDGALGITYSPYANDGTCKSESTIASEIKKLSGYSVIRLYATDCNQVSAVYNNLGSNQKLFLGIFDMSAITDGCNAIASAINHNWDVVHTISVGNELVNGGAATVGQVKGYVSSARGTLRGLGYQGPVVTTDTFIATMTNPGLCDVGDYVAVNAHAFFDGNVDAAGAGKWVLDQIEAVSATCGGKQTLVTESGWPHQGQTNGKCVPGVSEQQTALQSIKDTCGADVLLFTAFNDLWKSPGAFAAEQYWGIYGNSS